MEFPITYGCPRLGCNMQFECERERDQHVSLDHDPLPPPRAKRPAVKRPAFRDAIQWIAEQDEPSYTEPDEIEQESGVACALIADLWGCEPSYVAAKVAAYREAHA